MEHLEDEFSLRLLRHLVSGEGVDVNINALAKRLGIHRTTAKNKVKALIDQKILDYPKYPFIHLFQEYPLLVLAWADIPRISQARSFFEEDLNIFAAFPCMEGPYNTLLIEFFEDMESYHSWRETIVKDQKLPRRENRTAAEVYMFSNKLEFKYDPACFLNNMRSEFKSNKKMMIGDHKLDKTDFRIFELLLSGEYIHVNETYLANKLGTNRKKIGRRIEKLLKDNIVAPARCYFPDLLAPPKYNMIISMIELKSNRSEIKKFILADNNIPRALESSIGRYNILLFSAFPAIDEFFEWGDRLINKFPESIGAMSNTILSSRTMHTINAQKVSLGLIEKMLLELRRQKARQK